MKKLLLCCVTLALLITGCATTTQTALQRRTYEAKELEGSYEDAFKATMQVLQDNGYIIKSTDHAAGVIQAETGMKLGGRSAVVKTINMEITATLEQFGENRVRERISLVNKTKKAYAYGTNIENSTIVDDPELFQKMYDEIQKEMFIRKNLNK